MIGVQAGELKICTVYRYGAINMLYHRRGISISSRGRAVPK